MTTLSTQDEVRADLAPADNRSIADILAAIFNNPPADPPVGKKFDELFRLYRDEL